MDTWIYKMISGNLNFSGTVQASDGTMLPLASLPRFYTYTGSFLTQQSVNYAGNIYVQNYMNDGTNYTYVSNWLLNTSPIPGDIMVTDDGDIMITESGDTMITE